MRAARPEDGSPQPPAGGEIAIRGADGGRILASLVIEMPDSTRSAKEVTQAIGCKVEQIAKSHVSRLFVTQRYSRAIQLSPMALLSCLKDIDYTAIFGL